MTAAVMCSDELLDACCRVVDAATRALTGGTRRPPQAPDDLGAATQVLSRLAVSLEDVGGPDPVAVSAALVEVRRLQLAIHDTRQHSRNAVTAELHGALARLRTESTVDAVLSRIPIELGGLGFSRTLLSRLRGRDWGATGAFAHDDETLASALVRVGRTVPGRLGREEPETEMVRRRCPIIVRDAQRTPRVHRELIMLADTRDYVAAPIVADGRVMALLHVDRHDQADLLDGFDRDMVGLFAQGAGLALECVRSREQFGLLQRRLEGQLAALRHAADGSTSWDDDEPGAESESCRDVVVLAWPHPPAGPLGDLTRREWEVLRQLGPGASNQEIAQRLGVSVATVKTHIKHVLRKLGVESRTEAAAQLQRHLATSG